MDILNPAAPAIPHKEATYGQAAIDDAEKTLSDFKKVSKQANADATLLVKAAKDLVKEVKFNCEQSQQKMATKEWSQEELDQSRANLKTKQEAAWQGLADKADALKLSVEGHYKIMVASRDNITRARGDAVTGAVLGALTKDQKLVRKVFDNKLKAGFDEATVAYNGLASYPDGLLTQIGLLHKKSLEALAVGTTGGEKESNLYLASLTEKSK